MRVSLTNGQKILVVIAFFAVAVVGFMVKLPPGFRHIDKELHAAFYFLAAALLSLLFAGTNPIKHIAVFAFLYLFGTAIEYAQEYSNKFFHSKIHGRFDPVDVQWNLKGLIAFSALWCLCTIAVLLYKRTSLTEDRYKAKAP